LGRWLARADILNLLEARLRVRELEKCSPEIFEREITEPIFITGAPRSGTSILHRLMGEDPDNRIPLMWEAIYPCPPPEPATYRTDRRIRAADRLLGLWMSIVPGYRTIHDLYATVPSECGMLMNGSGLSDQLAICYSAPSYDALVFGPQADLRKSYEWHKKILQVLQWSKPGRWVLKAPGHMSHIRTLFAVYPDARVIQTHRDPLRVIPSTCSLLNTQLSMRSDSVDFDSIRKGFTSEGLLWLLDSMAAFRDGGSVPASRFYDVLYDDLMLDPVATIAKAYAHFGRELSAGAAAAVRACLEKHPKDAQGRHDYSFGAWGATLSAERAKFLPYQRRYGVRSET